MEFKDKALLPEEEIENLVCPKCKKPLKFDYIYTTFVSECCDTIYSCRQMDRNCTMYETFIIESKI